MRLNQKAVAADFLQTCQANYLDLSRRAERAEVEYWLAKEHLESMRAQRDEAFALWQSVRERSDPVDE